MLITYSDQGKRNVLPSAQAGPAPSRQLNIAYLRTLTDGKPGLIRELLTMFSTESASFLAKAPTYLRDKEYPKLAKLAHGMKPGGTYLGADLLTILMTELEKAATNRDEAQMKLILDEITTVINSLHADIQTYLQKT